MESFVCWMCSENHVAGDFRFDKKLLRPCWMEGTCTMFYLLLYWLPGPCRIVSPVGTRWQQTRSWLHCPWHCTDFCVDTFSVNFELECSLHILVSGPEGLKEPFRFSYTRRKAAPIYCTVSSLIHFFRVENYYMRFGLRVSLKHCVQREPANTSNMNNLLYIYRMFGSISPVFYTQAFYFVLCYVPFCEFLVESVHLDVKIPIFLSFLVSVDHARPLQIP